MCELAADHDGKENSAGILAESDSDWNQSNTLIVKMDMEGMVCKRKNSPYRVTEKPSPYWIKVKNPRYSQLEGREELFERR
jgi:ATP-dependent DNA ligase